MNFVYPFSKKETVVIPVLPNVSDISSGFNLKDYELSSQNYVQDVDNTISPSASKSFGTCKRSKKKLHGAFITHIDVYPVFSTTKARDKLKALYKQFLKAKDHGVAKKILFEITSAPEDILKGKLLKHAIGDYHFLLPGTMK